MVFTIAIRKKPLQYMYVHLVTFLETCVARKTQQGVISYHVIAGAYPYTYQEEAPALHVHLVTFLETCTSQQGGVICKSHIPRMSVTMCMGTCVQEAVSCSMP